MKKKLVICLLIISFAAASVAGAASLNYGKNGGTSGNGWVYGWTSYGTTSGGETIWVESLLRDSNYNLIGQNENTDLEYAYTRTSTVYGLDWTLCHAYGSYMIL